MTHAPVPDLRGPRRARRARRITGTTTRDFDVRAVATSVTATMDVLLIGRDPEALVAAYQRVVELGGGLVCPGAEVALPTFGHLSPLPVPELADARSSASSGRPDFPRDRRPLRTDLCF